VNDSAIGGQPWWVWGAVITALVAACGSALVGGEALLVKGHQGEFAALIFSAATFIAAAVVLVRMPSAATLARAVPAARIAVAAAWIGFAAGAWFLFAPDGWDESAYLLNGLALRGAPLPYAYYRAPVAGLLCAIFADAPSLLNAVLVLVLGSATWLWTRRTLGTTVAIVVMVLLLFQDHLMSASLDINSELPAAVVTTLAYLFLSRGNLFTGGVFLGLAILTRWNLGALAVATVGGAYFVWGRRGFFRVALGAAAPVLVGLLLGAIAGHSLIASAVGQFHGARSYVHAGEPVPSLWTRAGRYLPQSFYLTPLGLLALLWSPFSPAREDRDRDPVLTFLVPAGVLAYCAAMLCVGGILPRFFTPVIPVTIVVLWRVFLDLTAGLRHEHRVLAGVAACAITLATGLFPLGSVGGAYKNLSYRPAISADVAAAITSRTGAHETIAMPPVPSLATQGALALTYELRRAVAFPTAHLGVTAAIRPELPKQDTIDRLLGAVHGGDAVVVPSWAVRKDRMDVLYAGSEWTLARVAAARK
jgi:hypothetical protein